MDNITQEAKKSIDGQHLRQVLDSLPSDLHEFYRLIVQRIPQSLRWETYVVLEVVSKYPRMTLTDVMFILESSSEESFPNSK